MSVAERLLWLAVTLLSSTIAALIAGILSHVASRSLVDAIIAGAVTFAGTEALLLAVLGFALANVPQKRR